MGFIDYFNQWGLWSDYVLSGILKFCYRKIDKMRYERLINSYLSRFVFKILPKGKMSALKQFINPQVSRLSIYPYYTPHTKNIFH